MNLISTVLCGSGDDFNYSRLGERLSQGSYPPSGTRVRDEGFDVLVLCAEECQDGDFPGAEVLKCPMDDAVLTADEWQRALAVSGRVARRIRAGKKALVTCRAGRNRSGLVSALTLHRLTGWSGARCVSYVQMCRPNALTNASFVSTLGKLL